MIQNCDKMYQSQLVKMLMWLIYMISVARLAYANDNQTQPEQRSIDDQAGSNSNPLPAFTAGFSAFSPVSFPGVTTEISPSNDNIGFGNAFNSDFFKNALDRKDTTPDGPEGREFANSFSNDFFKTNSPAEQTTASSAPEAKEADGFGKGFSNDFYNQNVEPEETTPVAVSSLAARNGTVNGTDVEGKDYGHHSGYGHEKCHTSYKTVYKTVYETTYKKKCHTTYDKKCHTEYYTTYKKKCHTSYSKKCSTSYKTVYNKKCKVHYDHKCYTTYKTVYETTYKEKCSTSYKKECHESGYGYHKDYHCKSVPVKHCSKHPVKHPKHVPQKHCTKVPKKSCHDVPKHIPQKHCKDIPHKHCTDHPVKHPKKVCKSIPKKHCTSHPVKHPKKVAHKVPVKHCSYHDSGYGHSGHGGYGHSGHSGHGGYGHSGHSGHGGYGHSGHSGYGHSGHSGHSGSGYGHSGHSGSGYGHSGHSGSGYGHDSHGYHSDHKPSIASGGGAGFGGGDFGGFGDSFKGFGGFGGGFGGFGKSNDNKDDNRKEEKGDAGAGGFAGEFSLVGPGAASEDVNKATSASPFGSSFLGAGFRSQAGNESQASETGKASDGSNAAGFTTPFTGLFNNVFGNNLKQGFGGNNRKGFGFDSYGDQAPQNGQTRPLETPPTAEKKSDGFFPSSPFGGSFGSFGFGSPFGFNSNNEAPEDDSNTRSSSYSHEVVSEDEGSGFEISSDYDNHEYHEESNGVDAEEGSGDPPLFPLAGTHSFSDFGDGEHSSPAVENYDEDGLTQGKLDYPNGDISSGTDNGVTPQSFVPSANNGFTSNKFGFGTTQIPQHEESPRYDGYQFNSNDANDFDAYTGADLNHPNEENIDGGSGFPNFSFKKRNLPETLHDSPSRKKLNFYPLPNSTENEKQEEEKPSFATVIGSALPNFRDGLGSFP